MDIKKLCLISGLLLVGCQPAVSNSSLESSQESSSSFISSSSIEGENKVVDERGLSEFDYSLANLVGKDQLGRLIERKDNFKSNKVNVGLFYSMWLGQHSTEQQAIYNISYLLETEEGTNALYSDADNPLTRMNEFHFWGEPLYGYYNTSDPYVLTRHIEMFINAQIDYLCIDATNLIVYTSPTKTLFDLLGKFQRQGFKIPKVCFYTNSNSAKAVNKIYDEFYKSGDYADIWFYLNSDKPLIIGVTHDSNGASDQVHNPAFNDYVSEEMMEYFDVRESQWPNMPFNDNGIPWMDWAYPQQLHYTSKSMAIPVAQHSHSRISVSYMDPESHRGYNNLTHELEDWKAGRSFQDMFDTAHTISQENPGVINNFLVTSFNEWMAIKYKNGNGVYFVDVFNKEYSRDIEMMKGGYDDNFYLQLLENVRNLKMTDYVEYAKDTLDIDINSANAKSVWKLAKANYVDMGEDAINRSYRGATSGVYYTDNSARNDVVKVKVAHSNEKVFFYIETKEPLTEYLEGDTKYMNILLKTEESENNFAGYNYLINRNIANGQSSVEVCDGGYNFHEVGKAEININGNVLQVAIPRSLLGLTNPSFEFKVTDNITHPEDIMDYYVSGESVPLGRLSYAY
ncbi:MAG: hypothetical protein LBM99_03100 [Bacillales bacterium]|jgi:hypothetical protein|nr:hypothetical protein [Bacillales bacterium]